MNSAVIAVASVASLVAIPIPDYTTIITKSIINTPLFSKEKMESEGGTGYQIRSRRFFM
jgi:hypothetical protein